MATPEGATKKKIKALLEEFDVRNAKDAGTFDKAAGWYYMPGQSGFGVRGIPDYIGHIAGRFFAIEAKAPGKEPSGFQQLQIDAIDCSGADVYIIDDDESLEQFRLWLIAYGDL